MVIALADHAAAHRVLIVDDDEEGRDLLMEELRDFEIEPTTVNGPYGHDIERMLSDIKHQEPEFVICDHKLQSAGLASFYGAEVVRRLMAQEIPAMLLTMYRSTERLDLRAVRSELPVVMGRDEFRIELVPDYLDICRREITAMPVDARRPHRVLVRVDDVPVDEKPPRIDAVVPSWSPDHAVGIPFSCIDPSIWSDVRPGTYLLGDINIGAELEDELFFKNLNEIVPTPEVET
jgi:CheY-like chemotaxis protein